MPRVVVTELTFEVPESFEERSIAMFGDQPDQKLSRFAIVCTRRPLEGAPLEETVMHELEGTLVKLKGSVLARTRTRVQGLPAVDVRMRTKPAGATAFLYQRSVAIDWGGTGVMFTASCAMKEREACDRHLDAMLKSTRFRRVR